MDKEEKLKAFIKSYNEISKCKEVVKNIDKDFFFEMTDCFINYIQQLETDLRGLPELESYNKAFAQEIEMLRTKVKELGKGQHSLIQSRRKWKARYYKEKTKVKELEEMYYNASKRSVDATNLYLQNEEREKKVKDKLKQEKNTIEMTYSQINGNYFMAQDRLDLINEILNLLEGENNDK